MWCIAALGFIGNAIVFFTFGKMRNQNASTVLFRCLAFVDSCLLISLSLTIALSSFLSVDPRLTYFYYSILSPLVDIARTATIWTPALIGVHRYIIVCKPLVAARVCTARNARIHFVSILVLSSLINFPEFLRTKLSLASSPWYRIGYDQVFRTGIINFIVPVVLLLLVTTRLVQSLQSSRKRRTELFEGHRQGQSDRMVDLMVIIILTVFIICHSTYPMLVTLRASGALLKLDVPFCESLYFIILATSEILVFLNSSVNCIICVVFNHNFRRILCQCSRPATAPRSPSHQPQTVTLTMSGSSTGWCRKGIHQWPLLLTWFNFNPSMDK